MKDRFAIFALLLGLAGSLQVFADESPAATLDALHQAGADANQAAFFSVLTEDVVFLGIEGSDRLEGQPLRDFFSNGFSGGIPWAYQSSRREIQLSADGSVAWFDELLQNKQLGRGRGSGVLIHNGEGWKVAQYNLALVTSQEKMTSTAGDNPEERVTTPSAATETPAASTAANTEETETRPKKSCRKFRHKTNRQSSC